MHTNENGSEYEATAVATFASVMINPQISTRIIERQYDIQKSTVNRILRIFKFYPYHTLT